MQENLAGQPMQGIHSAHVRPCLRNRVFLHQRAEQLGLLCYGNRACSTLMYTRYLSMWPRGRETSEEGSPMEKTAGAQLCILVGQSKADAGNLRFSSEVTQNKDRKSVV